MRGAADKSRAAAPDLLTQIREVVDPSALPEGWDLSPCPAALPLRPLIALVGHRSAGKSRLLPLLCRWSGLPGFDLDRLVEERTARSVEELFATGPGAFREAERAAFVSLRGPAIVATGGGFLSLHGDLLTGHTAVLVPVNFETYRARLLADRTRPRLRPELSLEEEIAQVFAEREARHAAVPTVSLLDFLRHTASGTWQRSA